MVMCIDMHQLSLIWISALACLGPAVSSRVTLWLRPDRRRQLRLLPIHFFHQKINKFYFWKCLSAVYMWRSKGHIKSHNIFRIFLFWVATGLSIFFFSFFLMYVVRFCSVSRTLCQNNQFTPNVLCPDLYMCMWPCMCTHMGCPRIELAAVWVSERERERVRLRLPSVCRGDISLS